jgi:hypothetical protein
LKPLEIHQDLLRRLEAELRVLVQSLQNDGLEGGREPLVRDAWRDRVLVEDHPLLVRRLQSAGDLRPHPDNGLLRKRPLRLQLLGQRGSPHQLHDDEVDPIRTVEVEDRRDVGMRQPGEGIRFPVEAAAGLVIRERAFGKDLDRHVAVELLVVGAEDLAHPARPQGLDDSVVSERAADHTVPQALIPTEGAAPLG